MTLNDLFRRFEQNEEKIFRNLEGMRRVKAKLALQKLGESLKRLELRYSEFQSIEKLLTTDFDTKEEGKNLSEIQLRLVDKMEAYHQQVYATMGAIILFLNFTGIKGTKQDHPIDSVQRFLKFLRSDPYRNRSVVHRPINEIIDSVEFRARFIDHPQNQPVNDWYTFGYLSAVYVVYFNYPDDYDLEKKLKVRYYPPTDKRSNPESPYYKPPIDCKDDFFVSPHPIRSFSALIVLIGHLAELDG